MTENLSIARRTSRRRAAATATALALILGPLAAVPAAGSAPALTRVVVSGSAGLDAAAAAVRAVGGRVLSAVPLVGALVAEVPAGVPLAPGLTVTPDRPLHLTSMPAKNDKPKKSRTSTATDDTVAGTSLRGTLGLAATGQEGAGVIIALVDTGVDAHPDLAGRIVGHVDVTGTATADQLDGYGHGTFLAGLLAGDGASSGGAYSGVAPGASVLDVRVADASGATSLVQVLQGLQAVIDTPKKDRPQVVSLALGAEADLPPALDPLTLALDALWRRGIVVVVPSGNDGAEGVVSSPGSDPRLITTGALDDAGTPARGDDTVAPFSSRGTVWGAERPDLVAPGAHTVGLRAAGSVIDTENPGSRVADSYFRGSGTSMSTAVVAGAVAGILAVQPKLTPDDVKSLLVGTAYRGPALTDGSGAGGLDLAAALAAAPSVKPGKVAKDEIPGADKAWWALSKALADDDAAAAAAAWDSLDPQARTWAARTWAGLSPETRAWVARTWAGASDQEWAARTWAARTWAGRTWADSAWTARTWADVGWSARTWAEGDWDARTWAARTWAGRTWAGRTWAGRTWAGGMWA